MVRQDGKRGTVTEKPARTSFEIFVSRHLSPATLATLPLALMPTVIPRNTVHRVRVDADTDIAEIIRRLTERDVELLEIRRCPQGPPRPPRQPVPWTVPPEDDGSDVVVPLPVRAAGTAVPEGRGDVEGSVLPLTASDGGAGRGRRRRRRAARG